MNSRMFFLPMITGLVLGIGAVLGGSWLWVEEAGPDPVILWDALSDAGGFPSHTATTADLLDQRVLVSTHDINARTAREIVESLLLLDRVNPGAPITLYLRTEGGWEADAFAIIDTMTHLSSPVHVVGMGEVHSAGVMILAAATGDRLVMPHTLLGYHTPHPDEFGASLDRYLDFMKATTRLPPAWLRLQDDDLQIFTAEEAIGYGVADRILADAGGE